MSLSANIKKLRMEKNMTQEQLAAVLGISPQAVSKWETSETYPDGALLVPLAQALHTSLDTLFDNDTSSMADIAPRVIRLLRETDVKDRFHVVRDIGWQIERGLFDCHMTEDEGYDPKTLAELKNASYILNDWGFTLISNGAEPFFSAFEQPAEGFGDFLRDREYLQTVFAALSRKDTFDALVYLHQKQENYVFESGVLRSDCGIAAECLEIVMSDLLFLRVVVKKELQINGEDRVLYASRPSHKLIALLLIARELGYSGPYSQQSHFRSTPLLRSI